MFAPADYGPIGPGFYELQNCEILGRRKGEQHWFTFGDCDSARLEVTATKIGRKARNRRVRVTVVEAVTDLVASLSLRAMQFHDDVRAIALMGDPVAHTQEAGPFTLPIPVAKIGGIYFIDKLDIKTAAAKAATLVEGVFTPGADLGAGSFKIVDESAGAIKLLGGFANGSPVQLSGTVAAIVEADNRTRIAFASKTQQDLEIKIRGVSDIGQKFMFDLPGWQPSPAGIDLIGGDDFSGQDISGAVLAVSGDSVGTWQKLAA